MRTEPDDDLRQRVKRNGMTGNDVQIAFRPALQAKRQEPAHVPNTNVVALLLAVTEQGDFAVLDGRPHETVRAITVMSVSRPIDGTGPDHAKRNSRLGQGESQH